MRIPTFSRHSAPETPEAERPAPAGTATTTDPRGDARAAETRTDGPRAAETRPADARTPAETRTTPIQPRRDDRPGNERRGGRYDERRGDQRYDDEPNTAELPPPPARADRSTPPPPPSTVSRPVFPKDDPDTTRTAETEKTPVVAGPKPRASLLATLGLILGVAAVLLVLSGPLLGWGIGVAGVALVLSLGGIRATGKRHVAGKTDALIGMILALGAIVLGVLALTGSLTWLGTDTNNVPAFRDWLDTNTVNRF